MLDSTRFALAEGLYWFCTENYDGMGDPLYRILCQLDYTPARGEHGPDGSAMAARTYIHLAMRPYRQQVALAERLLRAIQR